MKKSGCVVAGILMVLIFFVSVSALDIEFYTMPIQSSYIVDINEPAMFDLTITNFGETDTFEIYSLVGVDISPKTITINSKETKKITINVMPQESLKMKKLPLNFVYKIKNSKGEIKEDSLSINIIGLESAFSLTPSSINPGSEKISITIKNNLNLNFETIAINLQSAFFDFQDSYTISPREILQIDIPLSKEKIRSLDAGRYLMNTELTFRGKTAEIENQLYFEEQENIETTENKKGFFIHTTEITKENKGNVRKTVAISLEKNIISFLFTDLNENPSETYVTGLTRVYSWEKELGPGEKITISAKTNGFYPLIILILIIIGIILIRKYIYADLVLRKKVSFVKTKGGEFALKVSIVIKAKKFIEHIKITDKLPYLVELYEKFGAIKTDTIDVKNKRLEWNIEALNKGESRIFTYIIYSKIGVVGRFELPSTHAIYEKEGEIKETNSNRCFYVNEPREKYTTVSE